MNLEAFGQKLRELRTGSGLTQAGLAQQISVSADLISIWERAYQYRGRIWRPDRASVARLVKIFADHLDSVEAYHWVALAGYTLGQSELQEIFSSATSIAPPPEGQAKPDQVTLLPEQRLFGIKQDQQQLRSVLEQVGPPWLVALDGIGGIGKTSLAGALVRELMPTGRFHALAWVSAKQEEFLPFSATKSTHRLALDTATLTDALLAQLGDSLLMTRSPAEKQASLAALLKQQPYLVVIDNLETVADYETLLPTLYRWANPTKFLITSRHALLAYDDVYCFSLRELGRADALDLLNYEARIRGATALTRASPAQLSSIYDVTGGNPLALKLVVGQTRVLPLAQVLENLRQAQGKTVEDLYSYIYWQAWNALHEAGRKVLLVMPLAQGGTLAQVAALSELDPADLAQALEHLAMLSLLEITDDLEQPRYRIHRLTESFLLNEVVKWQALA